MSHPIASIKSFLRSQINHFRAGKRGKATVNAWMEKMKHIKVERLADASQNIFTYHGEDGIILYLLQHMQQVPAHFVDIGAGDAIRGNCTTLAVHMGWNGLFIDQDSSKLGKGRSFHEKHGNTTDNLFLQKKVTPGNINEIISEAGAPTLTGLLSIDIDGNDYWVWKALTVINPRIVVIEAKVEFGLRDVVVPYGETNARNHDLEYNGASVEALRRLGMEKGYKLVGANKQGYNLFFVQEAEPFPAVTTETLLNDSAIRSSFYPESFFASHKFAG